MKIPSLDELRVSYDELHRQDTFESSRIAQDFCRRHGPWQGRRILDVGCGRGDFLAVAKDAGPEICGLDISPVAISEAKKRLPQADLRVGAAEDLPWENDVFDWVVCFGTLEHLTDPEGGVREMRRVCGPKGLIYIHLPNCYWWRYVLKAWLRGGGPEKYQPWEWFIPRAEWEHLLETNGLRILKVESWRPSLVLDVMRFKEMVGTFIEALVPVNLASGFGLLATRDEI